MGEVINFDKSKPAQKQGPPRRTAIITIEEYGDGTKCTGLKVSAQGQPGAGSGWVSSEHLEHWVAWAMTQWLSNVAQESRSKLPWWRRIFR